MTGTRTSRARATRARSRLALVAGVAVAFALAGCTGGDAGVDPAGIEEADTYAEDGALDDAIEDREALGVPEECAAAFVGAVVPADLADVEARPADWPEPPAGSTLCVTGGGGSVETASYAATAGIDEVLAHYESVLPASYERFRVSGEENGTGYESLDGQGAEVAFQIRESDGGFVIAFALQEGLE
ncbi:hypothetical protein [Agromyces aerolatus]|uniref:hypothetical protein n=1 Tax=Agromyces sp. LY-1074 TaxID=3074080 RepID=UPI00285ACF5B|nr:MULTISPECIES: hypothetical protein [unclassified Agromyces]MDR5698574.1 hypothetical protein [Agromyces sp. LY-1074]MDR5704868.1 hypothetical protein [Agromyces sp. LY-1358]